MTPKMEGQMFRMLMPQEAKPTVRIIARLETLVNVPFKTMNSNRQMALTKPIFRKVAA